MRRKSERTKASPSVKQPENVTRRTTRRNKKSPEKSITEEDSDNSSEKASDSEPEVQEVVETKRAKRLNRGDKSSVVEEVKERPTRGKRKSSVRSAGTNEEDSTSEFVQKPDPIPEECVTPSEATDEPTTEHHDNGDNEKIENAEMTENAVNAESIATVAESPKPATVDESNSMEINNDVADQPDDNTNISDNDQAQLLEREVIPEDAGEAVEDNSTAESAASNNHKNELNDFSATEVVASNITNNISERTVDGRSEDGEVGGGALEDTKSDADDPERKSPSDRSDELSDAPAAEIVAQKTDEQPDKPTEQPKVQQIQAENDTEKEIEKENSPKQIVNKPIVRKRKWLSSKNSSVKKAEISISTDSLKGLIPDVKPVPLSDINLESNSEPEPEEPNEVDSESEEEKSVTRTISVESSRRSEERIITVVPNETVAPAPSANINLVRKVSIVPEMSATRPLSPAKNTPSCILYITNLVRPFTALQLKGLLARTGKIVENGFWMDKIKSKCYVKFETDDEAVETRHALHGVRWPTSNPKCLNVDFGSEIHMDRAIASTSEDGKPAINLREERAPHPWDRTEGEREKIHAAEKPVREWDLGKKGDIIRRVRDPEREEKDNPRETARAASNTDRNREREGDRDRERDRGDRDRGERGERGDRRRRSAEKRNRSESVSPGRKFARKDNEPPLRLLDDLFRKTKAPPCIYWLPLTPEQIAVKEEIRQKQLAEHQRRIDALKKERADRDREREQGREQRDGDRDRDRRRRDGSKSSRDRDRGGRRRN